MYTPPLQTLMVKRCLKGHELLLSYKKQAKNAPEIERFALAKKMEETWEKFSIPFPFPAVSTRADYWYLAQLFATERHIHKDGHSYGFHFDQQFTIQMDSLLVDGIHQQQTILHRLLSLLPSTPDVPLSRFDIDRLLDTYGEELLQNMGISSRKWELRLMPYDIFLRLSIAVHPTITNIFFDGYRIRTDEVKTSLFGGNPYFGGKTFIDSLWIDSKNTSIVPAIVILPKGIYA
jgi:hypothetical protein